MMDTLSGLAQRLDATLHGGDHGFARVITDTRKLERGDLYVALKGENFDGHDFVADAAAKGAAGALVSRRVDCALSQVCVDDTLTGLQNYAAGWRAQFELPVVAVTGSNGKTTTKEMVASILRAWLRDDALATSGNLNNDIGVPLTLLRLRASHRAAVFELVEENAPRHLPVTAGASGLLIIGFERAGHVVVDDEANVRLVDAHAECVRCDEGMEIAGHEAFLRLPSLPGRHPAVVLADPESKPA